jgi:hypothetical protein
MKVSIKKLGISMDIKSKGMELDVYSTDGKTHLGDLVVTMTGLTWCKGRTTVPNGVKRTWKEFIAFMESSE